MIILSDMIIQKVDLSQQNVDNCICSFKAIEVGKNVHISNILHGDKTVRTVKLG